MQRKSVALLIETSNSYSRGVLEGIADYVRHHERWSIFLPEQERGGRPPAWLSGWKGDGIIARIETDEIARAIRNTRLPVVDVSAARHLQNVPWVETDDRAIGRLAADHLLERGFRNLAFCGDPSFNWSKWRQKHFETAVTNAGASFFSHNSVPLMSSDYSWTQDQRGLRKWINSLPRPVGILACYDVQAQKLLSVCRELEVAVPEEVAVLGVDNDSLLCDLAEPPLSSVICNTRRTGYEAAALLDRMLAGEEVGSSSVLIEPLGVQTRQSTDILAIDDPEIATAVRYIREHAFGGINVSDVLNVVPMSRRVLESRFQRWLGRTPHEEISRLKVEKLRQLLTGTDLSLTEISRLTGFEHDEYMSVFFRKATGQPPGKYRQTMRGKAD